MGDAQPQDGIPARLSPEYPIGTPGALLDVFSVNQTYPSSENCHNFYICISESGASD